MSQANQESSPQKAWTPTGWEKNAKAPKEKPSLLSEAGHLGAEAASWVAGTSPQVTQQAYQNMHRPGILNKAIGGLEYGVSGIPYAGAPLAQAMMEAGRGQYGKSAIHTAEAIPLALSMPMAGEKLASQVASKGAEEFLPEEAAALRKAGVAEIPSKAKALVSPSAQSDIFSRYLNAKGIDIANKLQDARQKVRAFIGDQANKFVSAVDAKHPEGYFDVNQVLDASRGLWDRLHAISVTMPPEMRAVMEAEINQDPEMKALSDASVFRKGAGDASSVQSLKEAMLRSREGRPLSESQMAQLQQIASERGESLGAGGAGDGGSQPVKWTAAQTKDLRTKIGNLIDKLDSMASPGTESKRLKAAQGAAYSGLTELMRGAAEDAGVSKEFETYNKAAKNLARVNDSLVRPAIRAAKEHGGEAVARILARDPGELNDALKNLSGFGLDRDEVRDFARLAKREGTSSPAWRRSIFRLAYGTPGGIIGMLGAYGLGAGWIPRIAAGAATGYLSDIARRGSKAVKLRELDPELLRILEEREIPVPMP